MTGSGSLPIPAESAADSGIRGHLLPQTGFAVHLHQRKQRTRWMRHLLPQQRLRTGADRDARRRSLEGSE